MLARKIVDELDRYGVAYMDDLCACFDRTGAQCVIAAELKPVREALTEGGDTCPCCGMPLDAHVNGCAVGNALAIIDGESSAEPFSPNGETHASSDQPRS